MLKVKFMALNVYIRKEKWLKFNDLNINFKELEKNIQKLNPNKVKEEKQ